MRPTKALLAHLDEYLHAHAKLVQMQKERAVHPTLRDKFWLSLLFAGLVLLGFLIPESLFSDPRWKEYGEHLLTWFFGAGLFINWFRSPEDLVKVSRSLPFRGFAVILAVVTFVLLLPIVSVAWKPVEAGTEIYIDEHPVPMLETYTSRLRTITGEIRTGRDRRPLQIPLLDLIKHRFSIQYDVRPEHEISLACLPNYCYPPLTLSFELKGEFDSPFLNYLLGQPITGITVKPPSTFELEIPDSETPKLKMVSGAYNVTAKKATCTFKLTSLTVGGDNDLKYEISMKNCPWEIELAYL